MRGRHHTDATQAYSFPNGATMDPSGHRRGHRGPPLAPLVTQSLSWMRGLVMEGYAGSETTGAASGQVGIAGRSCMAMRTFGGYNLANYCAHRRSFGERLPPPLRHEAARLQKELSGG